MSESDPFDPPHSDTPGLGAALETLIGQIMAERPSTDMRDAVVTALASCCVHLAGEAESILARVEGEEHGRDIAGNAAIAVAHASGHVAGQLAGNDRNSTLAHMVRAMFHEADATAPTIPERDDDEGITFGPPLALHFGED